METFTHDLMFLFESSDTFKIVARTKDGREADLIETGTDGLHAAQFGWRLKYSKYGDLEDKIAEISALPVKS